MTKSDFDQKLAEIVETVGERPLATQISALEIVIAMLAKRGPQGGALRHALKAMSEMSMEGAPVELVAIKLKLSIALNAAQDDSALPAAINAAFRLAPR